MQPSRSHLDRLPNTVSPHWEAHRLEWEAARCEQETVPPATVALALSVDSVEQACKGPPVLCLLTGIARHLLAGSDFPMLTVKH